MNAKEKRERFRALLAAQRCVYPAQLFDPFSARIAHDLGYEAGILGGSTAAMAILGAPDLALITLTELAELCRRLCRASDLPVFADADHGYGNALSAMRSVGELEAAGVAALSIEDIVLPRPYGSAGEPGVVALDEAVGRLRAAIAARRDPALVLVARLTGLRSEGLAATLVRVHAYAALGIDAIMPIGADRAEELLAFRDAAGLPMVVGGSALDEGGLPALARRGARLYLQGHQAFPASVQATYATMKALRDGTPPGAIANLASADLMARLSRHGDYDRWTRDYLGCPDGETTLRRWIR